VKGSKTQVELSAIAGAVLLSTAKRTKAWYWSWRFTQHTVTRSRHARRLGWFDWLNDLVRRTVNGAGWGTRLCWTRWLAKSTTWVWTASWFGAP